jgi:hypothetical protein
VTREELIAKLWPKGVVDFDTGLNSAVRKLRSALGDEADSRVTSRRFRAAATGSSAVSHRRVLKRRRSARPSETSLP